MKRPRLTITRLMVINVVVGADCAWARYNLVHRRSLLGLYAPAFDAGVWPLASLLILGFQRVFWLRGRPPRFLIGFGFCGLAALLGFIALNWGGRWDPTRGTSHRAVLLLLRPVYTAWGVLGSGHPPDVYLYLADAVFFTLPQALLATIGGLVVVRRAPVEPL